MPIYEYKCSACGRRHEILQKISAPPLHDCPDCGKPELVKLVSAAGFRLAGSGWYETDFKTGNKRNLAGADTKDAKDKQGGKKEGQAKQGQTQQAAGAGKSAAPASGTGSSSSKNPGHGGGGN